LVPAISAWEGIVQLRGLFAARETQVLAQSFLARFPFPTRIVEQLAYGKDLKGGVPGIAQVPGIIAFTGGSTSTSAGSAPAAPPTRMGPALRPASIAPRMYSNSGRRRLKVAEGSNSDARF
jgi:hypothetical protein